MELVGLNLRWISSRVDERIQVLQTIQSQVHGKISSPLTSVHVLELMSEFLSLATTTSRSDVAALEDRPRSRMGGLSEEVLRLMFNICETSLVTCEEPGPPLDGDRHGLTAHLFYEATFAAEHERSLQLRIQSLKLLQALLRWVGQPQLELFAPGVVSGLTRILRGAGRESTSVTVSTVNCLESIVRRLFIARPSRILITEQANHNENESGRVPFSEFLQGLKSSTYHVEEGNETARRVLLLLSSVLDNPNGVAFHGQAPVNSAIVTLLATSLARLPSAGADTILSTLQAKLVARDPTVAQQAKKRFVELYRAGYVTFAQLETIVEREIQKSWIDEDVTRQRIVGGMVAAETIDQLDVLFVRVDGK
uniref:TTI1 N-terminal TPR domain-containing protein n=1 Tax=Compsopogon caeruleus TaxID=31354 RepID=A0A7S1TJ80_9RHOD|mmetsp:Transcript_8836/g.17850  ORF Transcript_8836/g.17850 Transcript_8836/m.17850 type:complete len:366 (+) Transcript_8836:14-1111(+)